MEPGPFSIQRKTGQERFTIEEKPLAYDLLDFWQWAGSDLVNNTARGRLAEYIVARALEIPLTVRQEWTECDLQTASGLTIEGKVRCLHPELASERPLGHPVRDRQQTLVGPCEQSDVA
jgi:hypothetical protein